MIPARPLLAPAKAWFMTYRILAVLVWAQSVVILGSATAVSLTGMFDFKLFLMVFSLASLVQGFPAHVVNEIYDWRSGADRHTKLGEKSGGSKVLKAGLATITQLWVIFWLTTLACVGLIWVLYLKTDALVLAIFVVGFLLTLAYSIPPLRFAYRPFIGEWCGGFSGVVLTFCGSFYVQAGWIDFTVFGLSAVIGIIYIGIMILFHYVDRDGDRAASPRKNTTIVFLGPVLTKRYVVALLVLSFLGMIWLLQSLDWKFAILLMLIAIHVFIHSQCDIKNSTAIVRSGKRMTYITLIAVLCLSSWIELQFLWMAGLIAASFQLHRRFGKLKRAHLGEMPCSSP